VAVPGAAIPGRAVPGAVEANPAGAAEVAGRGNPFADAAAGFADDIVAKLGGVCAGVVGALVGAAGRAMPLDATCAVCGCIPTGEAATDWMPVGVAVAEGDRG
jgi:hypothetical protein